MNNKENQPRRVLITGTAGFIGFHLAELLLAEGFQVHGYDGMTDYYDVNLKRRRYQMLLQHPAFEATEGMLEDEATLWSVAESFKPEVIVHLAAQAGVRYSLENPRAYIDSNVIGTLNVMEAARKLGVEHLLMASTSSVYGANEEMPFIETEKADTQLTIYAATKKANETMAHSYAHIHALPTTMFRFFTVYGPWGRPDMAPTLFARAICAGQPLKLFNEGKNLRDFTYIDDIVDGVVKVLLYPAAERLSPPFRLFNLGHHRPVETVLFVKMLEQLLGKPAQIELLPPQTGDMFETCADLTRVTAAVGYTPKVPLEEGLRHFVAWFRDYYQLPR